MRCSFLKNLSYVDFFAVSHCSEGVLRLRFPQNPNTCCEPDNNNEQKRGKIIRMQNFIIQTGLASRLSKEIDKSQKDKPFPISKNLSSVRNLTNLYKDIKKKLKNKLKKSFSSKPSYRHLHPRPPDPKKSRSSRQATNVSKNSTPRPAIREKRKFEYFAESFDMANQKQTAHTTVFLSLPPITETGL